MAKFPDFGTIPQARLPPTRFNDGTGSLKLGWGRVDRLLRKFSSADRPSGKVSWPAAGV